MKALTDVLSTTLINHLITNGQRAWYGVARDVFVDDSRYDGYQEERKGYKFDEVADARSLLEQFMITTAADKALTCIKPRMEEPFVSDLPENNSDVLMFFRQRTAQPNATQETALMSTETDQDETQQPERTNEVQAEKGAKNQNQEAADKQLAGRSTKKKPQDQTRKGAEFQSEQEEYRAKITGRVTTGRSLLQELSKKVQDKESTPPPVAPRKDSRGRKWYDSADYP